MLVLNVANTLKIGIGDLHELGWNNILDRLWQGEVELITKLNYMFNVVHFLIEQT